MNAAMLLLVAGSFAPAAPTTLTPTAQAFAPSVVATFLSADAPMPALSPSVAPAATGATDPALHVFVEGGAWVHPGMWGLIGGGATFRPLKSNDKISIQGDVLLGWEKVTTTVQTTALLGAQVSTSRRLFALFAFNVVYALQFQLGPFNPAVGGGVYFDHEPFDTTVRADVKLQFIHKMANGGFIKPEMRFILAHSVPLLVLFSYGFPIGG